MKGSTYCTIGVESARENLGEPLQRNFKRSSLDLIMNTYFRN